MVFGECGPMQLHPLPFIAPVIERAALQALPLLVLIEQGSEEQPGASLVQQLSRPVRSHGAEDAPPYAAKPGLQAVVDTWQAGDGDSNKRVLALALNES